MRSTFIALTALIVTALLAPAAAMAAELPLASATTTSTPTIAELTAKSTEASMAESKVVNALEWHDARIDAARERLADASSNRTREAIEGVMTSLLAERTTLAAEVAEAREDAEVAQGALADAQAALAASQAAGAARVRAEQAAAYGLFPVAGDCEYIDSWGFPRSGGRRHKGTDIMAAAGTPVVALKDGMVTSGSSSLGGITLWLETDDGTRYYYAHLQTIEVGTGRVVAGQSSGTSAAPGTRARARRTFTSKSIGPRP